MTQPSRRPLNATPQRPAPRVLHRIVTSIAVLLIALLVVGWLYQTISETVDQQRYPPPGQSVDVGEYTLHLYATGPENGANVLLDAAWNSSAPEWAWVQPELSRFARVIAFDRPGIGYSDAPPNPVSGTQFAQDLHSALQQSGFTGPYIVVGHSMGSLTTRTFATLYPDEVVGMVLVDPRHLDIESLRRDVFPEQEATSYTPTVVDYLLPIGARFGIMRLMNPLGPFIDQLPAESQGRAHALSTSTHQWEGALADTLLGESAATFLMAEEKPMNIPLIVLSGGAASVTDFPEGARQRFTATHAYMVETLSPQGEHRIVEGANHFTIVTHRDYASQVTDAILDVVKITQQ